MNNNTTSTTEIISINVFVYFEFEDDVGTFDTNKEY